MTDANGLFRPDIEGLRAVSIIAVVVYHAFPGFLGGGFVGVDIFFVISGFLITRLLLREWHGTGRIDLISFWQRRIRRILPAATLVLVAVAILLMLFPILDGRQLGRHILSAALFYHNVRLARNATDYLAEDHSQNPLLHYWSLSVEERFYLAWPLILLAVLYAVQQFGSRFRDLILVLVIGLIIVLSFGYSIYLMATEPAWAFFGTVPRAWQLLTGAVLAGLEPMARRPSHRLANLLVVCALATIAISFVLISTETRYPGYAALGPTLAAALLIYAGAAQPILSRLILCNAPMRSVGRVSFSWYLWHWPALVFGGLAFGNSPFYLTAMIVLSFGLSVATYRYVEQPIRLNKRFSLDWRQAYGLGFVLIGVGALTGATMRHLAPDAVHIGNGVFLSSGSIRADRPEIYADQCLVRFPVLQSPACVYGDRDAERTVVLFGDSYAGNWFDGLNEAAKLEGWRLVVRIKASCSPVDISQMVSDGPNPRPYTECAAWRETSLQEIEDLQPDVVFVSGASQGAVPSAELAVVTRLAHAERVIIIATSPNFPEHPIRCLRQASDVGSCQWPRTDPDNRYPVADIDALPINVEILDLSDRVCPSGICRSVLEGRVVMWDQLHFTTSFGKTFSEDFRAILEATF